MDSLILGLRVVVALGAVLGLMWYLQRRIGKGTGRRRADRALTVISRQSLGQKASVVVVDAAGHRFLLGVTEHAVNVLHTGDIPAEPEEEAPVPGPSRGFGEFARLLSEANPLSGLHGSAPADGSASDGSASDGVGLRSRGRHAEHPRVPPRLHPPECPCPRSRGPGLGPPAFARFDPRRLHVEAGRRRSQERTPQLIRPLTNGPAGVRTRPAVVSVAVRPSSVQPAVPPSSVRKLHNPKQPAPPGSWPSDSPPCCSPSCSCG